jgi:hypothetical protein
MPGFVPFIFIAFVALIIVGAIFGHIRAKKRREALAAWAKGRGLRFTREKDYSFDEKYPEFNCMRQGDDRYAYNICYGQWNDRATMAFDYHYETHSTDSKGRRTTTHHRFSAVIMRANVPLKPLMIRREHIFDKIGSVFGFDDIDFESAEFSRRFHVSSPDRKWAYDVLHARTMQFLLEQPPHSIEFDSRHIIAWRSGRRSGPAEHETAITLIQGILDRLPEYVKQQQTGQTDPAPTSR